eukprot:scaffold456147_cov13-Prasinocladus_malaysianus.AAC.1
MSESYRHLSMLTVLRLGRSHLAFFNFTQTTLYAFMLFCVNANHLRALMESPRQAAAAAPLSPLMVAIK